ncbi:MAG: hypothetical protein ACRDSJ_15180, partial [Rubrobacteraceae bacterium]
REFDPEFVELLGSNGKRVGLFGAAANLEEIERRARDHNKAVERALEQLTVLRFRHALARAFAGTRV